MTAQPCVECKKCNEARATSVAASCRKCTCLSASSESPAAARWASAGRLRHQMKWLAAPRDYRRIVILAETKRWCARVTGLLLIGALAAMSCQENREHAGSRWDSRDEGGKELLYSFHWCNKKTTTKRWMNNTTTGMWHLSGVGWSTLTSLLMSAPASSSIWTMASSPRTQAYMRGVMPCRQQRINKTLRGGHLIQDENSKCKMTTTWWSDKFKNSETFPERQRLSVIG